ncbi:MAG TPA: KH domain-containing protein, partial [Candidatus Saccharimonadales bacterium]|nr:KH domain-containing protein [Candidatus Saccharimonadales bacterium]
MNPDLIASAEKKLADLLTFFEVNPQVESEFDGETLHLRVEADTTGRLIGRRGETLQALQHLLNMMLRRETTERVYVQIDVGGYKQARLGRLVERAHELALKVAEDGQEAELAHLTP